MVPPMSLPVRVGCVLGLVLPAVPLTAQGPPANGPRAVDPGWHALVGGDLVPAPGQRMVNATIVLRQGRIVSMAEGAAPPAGARVWDCKGLTIYPGLVEPFLPVDVPAPEAGAPGTHWNRNVLAQRSALHGAGVAAEDRRGLRALGYTAAAIAPTGGVLKGTAAVVLLEDPPEGGKATVLRDRAFHVASLQGSGGDPNSEMGAIALLRQTLMDAAWRQRCAATVAQRPELGPLAADAALDALAGSPLPLGFDTQDELQVLRAARIADEAGRGAFAIGSGMEFRRLAAVAAARLPVVVPLDYPEAPDVSTLAAAERVSLRQLMSWEQAPTNTRRLLDAGVTVAWTTARLRDRGEFRRRMAEAMACGVDEAQALALLTTAPAKLLGVDETVGTVAPGRLANLVLVAGSLFDPKAKVRQVWVGGQPHDVDADRATELDGVWHAELALQNAVAGSLSVAGDKVTLTLGEQKVTASGVRRGPDRIDFQLADAALGQDGRFVLSGLRAGEELHGTGRTPGGESFGWSARRTGPAAARGETDEKRLPPPAIGPLPTPLEAFGLMEQPQARSVAFTGARIWTAGPDGILERGALWLRDGKIAYVGPATGLPQLPAGTAVVDATGKQITPGMIDCHSHTGISRGVNESGQAVTSEVRIQDVVNPDDVNWYRQLAGGVTAVNQLHGSANAIGGQSWVVKLRWGVAQPDEMALTGARPGIKFALGENPRRANSSSDNERYPNTRMGVAALIRDRFTAAADYREQWRRYEAMDARARAGVLPPRRDLELDALVEILAGERWVHCHSYRQDEIFMLCRLADEFGFRIGTFQHVLEGYKVADAIAGSAVGASAFSDWWAYKLEVYDAIPDNGAIMREQGVCVSFNSDSSELARRLNTEAGKAVKYGGVPPAEALKFVTLNPAIQVGIADRTGSLEPGKDADFVIWSGDPLSYTSRCEATFVDGRPAFTLERDRELRETVARERARLLQRALAAGGRGRAGGGDREAPGWDAFWRAEDLSEHYCCTDCLGGGR